MPDSESTTAPTAEDLALAEDLRQAVGSFVRSVRRQAGTPSTAQSETLGLLGREGPLSIAELAQRRKVRHQSMRLVVTQLEEAGLVARRINPGDGRSKLIFLTENGKAALGRGRDARRTEIARLIRNHLTEEERAVLHASIRLFARLA